MAIHKNRREPVELLEPMVGAMDCMELLTMTLSREATLRLLLLLRTPLGLLRLLLERRPLLLLPREPDDRRERHEEDRHDDGVDKSRDRVFAWSRSQPLVPRDCQRQQGSWRLGSRARPSHEGVPSGARAEERRARAESAFSFARRGGDAARGEGSTLLPRCINAQQKQRDDRCRRKRWTMVPSSMSLVSAASSSGSTYDIPIRRNSIFEKKST